jgi:diguanylate cyclase (GGDEF)-like protein
MQEKRARRRSVPLHPAGDRELAGLAAIARIATEDLELRPMLQRITDALAAAFGWELVALISLDLERRWFVCEALTTSVATEVRPGYGRAFGSGVVGEVAATGRTLLIDDPHDHPDFIEVFPGTRSELCAPIRHRGEVVAVLNLESPRPAAFAGHLPTVEAIADQISGAIASARLFEATRQRALHFEVLTEVSRAALGGADLRTILHRIATYIQRRFDFLLVDIVVAAASEVEWSYHAVATRTPIDVSDREIWAIDVGIVGRATRLGRPQLVRDVAEDPDYRAVSPDVKAEYVSPIRFGDRTLGAFNLENDDPEAFSTENLRLLDLVSDQVAGAIEMALLNEQISVTKSQLEESNRHLQSANRTLHQMSQIDPLTGVANRRRLEEALDLEWRRLARTGQPLSVLLCDVDCFKAYNDSLGHIAGDRCLQRIAGVLRDSVQRAGDLVARYGGEEFLVILSATDLAGAARLAEQARGRLAALAIDHPSSTVEPVVTLSVGVASVIPTGEPSPAQLVAAADRALYRAKQEGRDRVVVAD